MIVGFGTNYYYPFGRNPQTLKQSENDDDDHDNESSLPTMIQPDIIPMNLLENVSKQSNEKNRQLTLLGKKPKQQHLDKTKSSVSQIEIGATNVTLLTKDTEGVHGYSIYNVGTLGGSVYQMPTPLPTQLPLKCTKISAGRRHVLALMEGGSVVMSWGSDHFGQLGHGSSVTFLDSPTIIKRLLPMYVGGVVTEIAAGCLHSAAVVSLHTSSQKVFAWGFNSENQCGQESGKSNLVHYPLPVHGLPESSKIAYRKLALGKLHSVALTARGEVYSWGSTTFGRCGFPAAKAVGNLSRISLPRKVEGFSFRNAEGVLVKESISDIAVGDKHTLALSGNGRIYSWGCGEDGQLGHGISVKKIDYPRVILDLDFVTINQYSKKNNNKKSDDGKTRTKSKLKVTKLRTRSLNFERITLPRVVSVYASGNYSAALTNTKDVFTWGYGDGGQLGHTADISDLPHIDPMSSAVYEERTCDVQSFDSRYNTLLPKRIKCVRDAGFDVKDVACGPSNLILLCEKETNQGSWRGTPQSLFEVELNESIQNNDKIQ